MTDRTVKSDEDPANATTSAHDGLTIVKKINGNDANDAPGVTVEPGADMNVTYEVTNTGNRPVHNVTVTDKITTEGDKVVDGITASDEEKPKAAKLAPGQTVTFSAKVKAPATGGTLHTDLAQAHGVPPVLGTPDVPGPADGPKVESNEDPANATTSFKDGLTIVKKINGNDANDAPGVTVEPGADMNVTYEVTNTGNRPVFNVNVTDRVESENNAEVKNIAPAKVDRVNAGETVRFTATIKAPTTGGTLHTDLAQAHGVPPVLGTPDVPGPADGPKVESDEDPANATTSAHDGLAIVKKINGDDANDAPGVTVEPGADMQVTYEVTNTGNRPVYNVNVTDKITTEGDKAVDGITASDEAKAAKLNPNETVTFTATVKAPAANGTLHTDKATAHAVPPKPGKPNEPGDPKDPKTPPVNSNEDEANATTSFKDGLTIVKKINGDDANDAPGVTVEPGADMNVTYEVTNTGNRPVHNVTVADKITTEGDKAVEGITASDEEKAAKLNPNETVTFSATVKAPAANGTLHTDLAQAHAVPPKPGKPNEPGDPKDPKTPPVNSNEDPANATTSAHDGLAIVKKINGDDANDAPGVTVEPGADMQVTYEVTNTGNRPVYNVNVTDKITTEGDKAVDGITASDEAKAAKLNPNETVTFTATVKAPAANGTLHTDKATAHAVPPKPGKPNEPGDPNDPKTPPVNSNEDPANATTKTPAETSSSTPPAPPAVTSTTEPPASSTEPAPSTSTTEPSPSAPATSSTEPSATTSVPPAPTTPVTPPPTGSIPFLPLIPLLIPPIPLPVPPAPVMPPAPPVPGTVTPQVPVPPATRTPGAPEPGVPTPPTTVTPGVAGDRAPGAAQPSEAGRQGVLAKTGVSAGLGYALLAGLVLLVAGGVFVIAGLRRRQEGDRS